jgi:hypothetical protein
MTDHNGINDTERKYNHTWGKAQGLNNKNYKPVSIMIFWFNDEKI